LLVAGFESSPPPHPPKVGATAKKASAMEAKKVRRFMTATA
jgi:hypothetical protein